jgi:hypothetical protein
VDVVCCEIEAHIARLNHKSHWKITVDLPSHDRCDTFRAGRLQSLDRFKVEEDRSPEELQVSSTSTAQSL